MRRENYKDTAVFLLAFGGPQNLNEVEPFIKSVLAPRKVSIEQIKRAEKRYEVIGGKSPILDIAKRQAASLQKVLNKDFSGLRVYVGMRYWNPFIRQTIDQMVEDGIIKSVSEIMSPQNSPAVTGGYVSEVEKALEGVCHPERSEGSRTLDSSSQAPQNDSKCLKIDFLECWHTNEKFLNLFANRIKKELVGFEDSQNVHVIFSAHSLPLKAVENDPYVKQLNEMIDGVQKITGDLDYTLAYQSKGKSSGEWLGPEVENILEKLCEQKVNDVLLVPLSFVSDNIETLYDIDIVFKQKAKSLGLNFKRTPSFNDSADFIEVLAGIVSQKLKGNS